METCRGGIDPIRLAAEILEVPYLEVLDFKTKYLSRLFDDRLQELSEEVMRPLDITVSLVASVKLSRCFQNVYDFYLLYFR